MKTTNIVSVGGGKGHARLLKALKDLPHTRITAVCPTTDSGGSTGELRQDYGAGGYLGDLSRCVVALSPDKVLSEALNYRYGEGHVSNHMVRTLLLLALEKTAGQKEGLAAFEKLCGLDVHRVVPVTDKATELCATLTKGDQIVGETNIDFLAKNPRWHPSENAITDVYLEPNVSATQEVISEIEKADWFVIAPGDFYSSIIATLLPQGIAAALKRSSAKVVLVLNIMTKRGETDDYHAEDFIALVEKYIGRPVDIILHNDKKIPAAALTGYSLENKVEFTVGAEKGKDSRIRFAPFAHLSKEGYLGHDEKVLHQEFAKLIHGHQ